MSTTQVLVCCLLLVLACFVPNLVVHANHRTAQPWPILVDRYASCCTLLQHDISTDISLSYNELQSELSQLHPCVGRLHLEQSRLQQKYSTSTKSGVDARRSHGIAVVTMSMKSQGEHHIPQIELFSTYQRLVLGAYCEHRQYQYYDFETWQSSTPNEDGVLIEEVDVRWNKIMLLIEALHPVHGWARDVEAIVWIDSDAIVLDFALAIEDLLDEHHDADIIASADIKLGLINTGFFIVRNTHWARQVLQKWWTIADRKTVCDQDAFDQLYLQLLSESEEEYDMIQGKVKILSTDSINSHPPAWRYQSPSSRVLHLMGETAMFRAGIFRTGYQSICQARSGGFLSPQLSIYPETMIDLAK